MTAKVVLNIIAGPKMGQEIEFTEHDTFIFGRMDDCHICIPDDNLLSRHHFLLEANPPDSRIRDLGSLNGTYVNGNKIGGRLRMETPEEGAKRDYPQVDLQDGDEIKCGGTCFVVKTITTKPLQQKIRCQRCGKDVSAEAGSARSGDYLCSDCAKKLASNTANIWQELLDKLLQANNQVDIPNYEIMRQLGRGGMGEVYLVKHKGDNRLAALKILLSKIAVHPDAREKFLREIKIISALKDSNIVEFIEYGAVGSIFFFVMEYCERGNLVDLMTDLGRTLSPDEMMPIMVQVLDGLSYAHSRGIVHRDLKPQNILLRKNGPNLIAKISDFSLSKNFTQAGFSGMTITGNYAGSYPFMPREQVTNFKYVKPVSDIWSIAATFYFVLTGELPREMRKGQDPMEAILSGNIMPIRNRNSHITKGVANVIDRALSNNPNDRYQDAGDMKKALEKAI